MKPDYLTQIPCPCGHVHTAPEMEILIGSGTLSQLPAQIRRLGCRRPFLLADKNTMQAAGERASDLLMKEQFPLARYVFPEDHLEPDEHAVGSAIMHLPSDCDLILAVGSGVINDISKIVSNVSQKPYIIVATAPSMDGYASATSSMSRDGLKISLPSRCADVIIGDTDILKEAPLHMICSGIGDMIAKYVSIAEWRISHLITGEYDCPEIAQLIRDAVSRCVSQADALMRRDPKAVEAVFEGLIIGGIAMAYAGVSRPASGVEHYFSHVWDMRALQFGTPCDLHGIQCAMATYHAVRLYHALTRMTPDTQKALASVQAFDYDAWRETLRAFLGESAEAMIALEKTEGKYDKEKHAVRLGVIVTHWPEIQKILEEELPSLEELSQLLATLRISTDLSAVGVDTACARLTFQATRDIRDKYVLSRLAWDLGVTEELCALL